MKWEFRNDWIEQDGNFGFLCIGFWVENDQAHFGIAVLGFVLDVWIAGRAVNPGRKDGA